MNPANPAHYDYETLADLAEGLLEDDKAASVNEHLDTCAECRERSADLADVSRILAEAPVPSMPADLASRIDSAIAAESERTATVASLEHRRTRRRHWRILSAAAATVIVLGGGGVVAGMVLDGSDDRRSSANAPVADNDDRAASDAPGAAQGSKKPLVAPDGRAGARVPFRVSRSGTDYRAATLDKQVKDIITAPLGSSANADQAPPPALAGCVGEVTGGREPVLVDTARYEGAPATVVAAPGTTSKALDIWVVGQGCTAQDTKVIKHLAAAVRD